MYLGKELEKSMKSGKGKLSFSSFEKAVNKAMKTFNTDHPTCVDPAMDVAAMIAHIQ
jgi:hypothetical protein